MKYLKLLCLISLLNLTGCATLISGETESIAVTTTPVSGANCELTNKRGTWKINDTPGSVDVKRSLSDLTINCKTKDGLSGERKITTSLKSTTAGNLLLGGFIGGGVDAATGAAFDYPDNIEIAMKAK